MFVMVVHDGEDEPEDDPLSVVVIYAKSSSLTLPVVPYEAEVRYINLTRGAHSETNLADHQDSILI